MEASGVVDILIAETCLIASLDDTVSDTRVPEVIIGYINAVPLNAVGNWQSRHVSESGAAEFANHPDFFKHIKSGVSFTTEIGVLAHEDSSSGASQIELSPQVVGGPWSALLLFSLHRQRVGCLSHSSKWSHTISSSCGNFSRV